MGDEANGLRVLHPLRDDVRVHVREDPVTQRLEPLTDTGRFHIHLLRLNRPALVEHRLGQRFVALLVAERDLLRGHNDQLRQTVAVNQAYINLLRQLLEESAEDGKSW